MPVSTRAVATRRHYRLNPSPGAGGGGGGGGTYPTWTHFNTGHDNIPNFAVSKTITAQANGNWSSTATWDLGRVPQAGDIVGIPTGVTVTMDVNGTPAVTAVGVAGTLQFRTDVSTRLNTQHLMVYGPESLGAGNYGVLQIGTSAAPVSSSVTAEVVYSDVAIDTGSVGSPGADPAQFGNGLLCFGKVVVCGAAKTPGPIRLAAEALTGNTSLSLSASVSGWAAGDHVLVPDSHQPTYGTETGTNWNPLCEVIGLGSVTGGTTVNLAAALTHDHKGWHTASGTVDTAWLPHAANLTRNVVFRSANPAGTRGHTMFLESAWVDVRYAQFKDLGRTTNAPLDSTTFDGSGTLTHVGTNQIGRYPVHFHHLIGPANGLGYDAATDPNEFKPSDPANVAPVLNGPSFRFYGNTITDEVNAKPAFKWFAAIHDSHFGYYGYNTVYNAAGAGVMTEEGGEYHNVIEHNFNCKVYGTGSRQDFGRDGNFFHLSGPGNYVRHNIAATGSGDDIYCYGFNFFFEGPYNGSIGGQLAYVPAAQGAEPTVEYHVNELPVVEFNDCEVYSTAGGLAFWSLGLRDGIPFSPSKSAGTFSNFRVWHNYNYGCFAYWTDQLTIDGYTAHNDYSQLAATGMVFGDYVNKDLLVTNFDIQGYAHGADLLVASGVNYPTLGINRYGPATWQTGTLRNTLNIVSTPLITSSAWCDHITPVVINLNNIVFQNPPSSPAGHRDINLVQYEDWGSRTMNLQVAHQIYVRDYNGTVGDNFRVYFPWSDPTYVVPQTIIPAYSPGPHGELYLLLASPDSGKTNAQNWADHGIAIGGAVMPNTAVTRSLIDGKCDPF